MAEQLLGNNPDFTGNAINFMNSVSKAQLDQQYQQRAREAQAVIAQKQAEQSAMAQEAQLRMKADEDIKKLAMTADNYYETDDEGGAVYENYIENVDGVPTPKKRPKIAVKGGPFGAYKPMKAPWASTSGKGSGSEEDLGLMAENIAKLYETNPVEASRKFNTLKKDTQGKMIGVYEKNTGNQFKVANLATKDVNDFKATMIKLQDATRLIKTVDEAFDPLLKNKSDADVLAVGKGYLDKFAGFVGLNNEAKFYNDIQDTVLSIFAKTLGKEVGNLNEGEQARAKKWTPEITDTKTVAKQKMARLKDFVKNSADNAVYGLGTDMTAPEVKKNLLSQWAVDPYKNSTAIAKPKKFYSKSANKTKIVYPDGREEIVDGKQ